MSALFRQNRVLFSIHLLAKNYNFKQSNAKLVNLLKFEVRYRFRVALLIISFN